MLSACASLGASLGAAAVLGQASCSTPRQKVCVSTDGGESVLVDLDTDCPPGTDSDIS